MKQIMQVNLITPPPTPTQKNKGEVLFESFRQSRIWQKHYSNELEVKHINKIARKVTLSQRQSANRLGRKNMTLPFYCRIFA